MKMTCSELICTNLCELFSGPIFKIQFKFRQLEIPPNYDVNHLGKLKFFFSDYIFHS